ncbi:MAG: divalent-cation tolerance protein CutA [Candidatus Hodarchaeota archaeon]
MQNTLSKESPQKQIVVALTSTTPGTGKRLAKILVKRRIAACVTILPSVTSIYWWERTLQEETEELLLIKTRQEQIEILKASITELHEYSVPELMILPVIEGLEKYCNWIIQETTHEEPRRTGRD